MAYRIGTCTACRARFQIPATFTPNRARCRTCGGVVEIGSLQEGDSMPGAATARPAPPPPAAAPRAPERAQPPPAPAPAPVAKTRVEAPAAEPVRVAPSRPAAAVVAPKKKSTLVPILAAIVVLAAIGIGVWAFLQNSHPSESQAAPGTGASAPGKGTAAPGGSAPVPPPEPKVDDAAQPGH